MQLIDYRNLIATSMSSDTDEHAEAEWIMVNSGIKLGSTWEVSPSLSHLFLCAAEAVGGRSIPEVSSMPSRVVRGLG